MTIGLSPLKKPLEAYDGATCPRIHFTQGGNFENETAVTHLRPISVAMYLPVRILTYLPSSLSLSGQVLTVVAQFAIAHWATTYRRGNGAMPLPQTRGTKHMNPQYNKYVLCQLS